MWWIVGRVCCVCMSDGVVCACVMVLCLIEICEVTRKAYGADGVFCLKCKTYVLSFVVMILSDAVFPCQHIYVAALLWYTMLRLSFVCISTLNLDPLLLSIYDTGTCIVRYL